MTALTTVAVYQRELKGLISVEIESILEKMANGFVESYEEYRGLAGKIAGLRSAIDLIDEADRILSEKYR
jgi:hypothetical protein